MEIKERIQDALSRWNRYEIKKEMEPISNFASKIILTEMVRLRIYSHIIDASNGKLTPMT